MKITDDHRTVHEFVAEFGPITTADLAGRVEMTTSAVSALVSRLVARGHVAPCGEWAQTPRGQWVRQWEAGAVGLPPREERPALVLVEEPDEPEDAPQTPQQAERQCSDRSRLYELAVEAGLGPVADPKQEWRVSVPHPLGERGRVWVDTDADLALVLADLGRDPATVLDGPQRARKPGPEPFWLPGWPLVAWAERLGRSFADLSRGNASFTRGLSRINTREQLTVSLSWAERFADHAGVALETIWPDVDEALDEGRELRSAAGREQARAAA